jgi:hypothetical protein
MLLLLLFIVDSVPAAANSIFDAAAANSRIDAAATNL